MSDRYPDDRPSGERPADQVSPNDPSVEATGQAGDAYYDEHGDLIEYVDEHGNPVDAEGNPLEYVDEDGNPVDADGNPLDEDVTVLPAAEEDPRALGVVTSARRRNPLVGVVALLLCLGLVGVAVWFGLPQVRSVIGSLTEADDYPGPGSGSVEVVIKDGDSGNAIGSTLEKAGVVKSSSAFVSAVSEQGAANKLQPGTYQLKKEMSAEGALESLINPASRINIQVRVREGLWKSEVFAVIAKETGFTVEQLDAAAKDPEVGLPAEANGDPEGYLFPATYTFDPKVTPTQVLKAMVTKYTEEMNKAQVPEADRRRVLILASMVQAEASLPADFPKVARVIENRLIKQPKVPLGFDTTVNFAVQKRGFALTKSDLNSDSPYNTRKFPGLPPGPIDSPGAKAIEAAAHPSEGDWLYFVTTNPDTGETLFTADYNEFLKGKEQFNEWWKKNKASATP